MKVASSYVLQGGEVWIIASIILKSIVISLWRESEERSDTRALGLVGLICEFRFDCASL